MVCHIYTDVHVYIKNHKDLQVEIAAEDLKAAMVWSLTAAMA